MLPTKVQLDTRHELPKNPGNSVTQWISALKQGDQSAARGSGKRTFVGSWVWPVPGFAIPRDASPMKKTSP